MTLRPIAAHWFELVTTHPELARVMECLSRTGAVELETQSRATDRLLFTGLDEELKAHREIARRYQPYWPAPTSGPRRSEPLSDTLKAARARLANWVREADPIIDAVERLAREAVDLTQLRAALQAVGSNFPDIRALGGAGPKLQVRLLALPAGTLPREIPTLTLFKPWQTPEANYALVVGLPSDIADIAAQLPALKARVLPLPPWLPPLRADAIAAIEARLTELAKQRTDLTAQLDALSQRMWIAPALGDIALIEWLNDHAGDLRGSERLAWVTGWTSDVTGTQLGRALDAAGVRYILRLADAPEGLSPPLMLSNPAWARPFEVFARALGTCVYRKLDSAILVVKAAQNRVRRDGTDALNRAMERRVLVQGTMDPRTHYSRRHMRLGSGAGAFRRIRSCGPGTPGGSNQ